MRLQSLPFDGHVKRQRSASRCARRLSLTAHTPTMAGFSSPRPEVFDGAHARLPPTRWAKDLTRCTGVFVARRRNAARLGCGGWAPKSNEVNSRF
eukprot:2868525-Pyramimonas_sp.AAC.1